MLFSNNNSSSDDLVGFETTSEDECLCDFNDGTITDDNGVLTNPDPNNYNPVADDWGTGENGNGEIEKADNDSYARCYKYPVSGI